MVPVRELGMLVCNIIASTLPGCTSLGDLFVSGMVAAWQDRL